MLTSNSLEQVLDRILDAQILIVERLNRLEGSVAAVEQRQEAFIEEVATQHSQAPEELMKKADRLNRLLATARAHGGPAEPG